MLLRPASRAPIALFGLSLTAVYGIAAWILSRLARIDDPDLIAGALTVDLTVLVPALYYLLLVRWRGWPAITVLPVFILSVVVADSLIPDSRQHLLRLIAYGAGIAELGIVAFVLHKVFLVRRGYKKRSAAGLDVYDALRVSAGSVLGPVIGNALAYEIAVFYYASFGWGRRPAQGEETFTYRIESAYVPFAMALMMAVIVETVAIHLLVQLWSAVVAWILTAISVYAFVWVVGDTQAVRLRPIRIDSRRVHLRIGLRWTAEIPLERIVDSSYVSNGRLPRGTPNYLNTALLGQPNRRLELDSPVEILGPYGLKRPVTILDLQLDEAPRFDAALDRARA